MKNRIALPRGKRRQILAVFLSLLTLILVGGYFYYATESKSIRSSAASNLEAIGNLKVNEILQWRKERFGNVHSISRSPLFVQAVEQWLAHPSDPAAGKTIRDRLLLEKQAYGFRDIYLVSPDGKLRLSVDGAVKRIDPVVLFKAREALETEHVLESDFYTSSTDNTIHYDLVHAVRGENRRIRAVLVFSTDPNDYLYPLIQSWPTSSKSHETLLLRKDGDSILYLNDLRFRQNTALKLRFSLNTPDLPAARAAAGVRGIFEGVDYRGVRTLAYLSPVPNTPWFMVAKVDASEIFSELSYRTMMLIITSTILILLIGTGALVYYRASQLKLSDALLEKERALRMNEEKYRVLVEQATDGIFLADAEGRILDVNPSGCTMLGYSRDELLSRTMNDLVSVRGPNDGTPQANESVQGETGTWERLMIRKDGSLIPVEFSRKIMTNGYMQKIVRDITYRKQMEETLRIKDQEYRDLVETMDEGFCVVEIINDGDGKTIDYRYVAVNPAFEKLTGLTMPVGKTIRELAPDIEPYWFEVYGKVARTGQSIRFEAPSVPMQRHFDVFAYRIGANGSNKVGILFHDVTERRQMEHMLLDLHRREAVGVLSIGIAHHFNNLLGIMMGNVSIAQQRLTVDHPVYKNMSHAMTAIERAAELTGQILAYSGKAHVDIRTVDIAEEMRRQVSLMTPAIPHNVSLVSHLPSGTIYVHADPAQMKQVLTNMVMNGADAVGEKRGVVTVSLSSVHLGREELGDFDKIVNTEFGEGDYALLEVSDTGSGMNPDTRRHIFDPFFSTKFLGRGMGLSSVLGIIRAHEGGIAVESAEGAGSRFQVILPLTNPPKHATPRLADNQSVPMLKTTILVIDDEPQVAETISEILRLENHRVVTEVSSIAGIQTYKRFQGEIGLAILDMTMPEMSGKEVIDRLQEIEPDLRIIVSSGYSQDEVRQRLGSSAISGFLQKPYTSDVLLAMVREVMRDKVTVNARGH